MGNNLSHRVALKSHCQNLALSKFVVMKNKLILTKAKRKVNQTVIAMTLLEVLKYLWPSICPIVIYRIYYGTRPLLKLIDIATDSFDLLEGLNFSQNSKALRTSINHKLLDFSKPCCDQVMNTIARLTRGNCPNQNWFGQFLDDTKQVMLGNFGLEYMTSCDLETAICRLTVRDDTSGVYIVPDCTKHDLLKDNILVTDFPHVRFYAGAPIFVSR